MVQVDDINTGTPVLYNLTINNKPVQGLFDTVASMSIMSNKVYIQIHQKPKLSTCNRLVSSAEGDNLQPVGECFIQMRKGKKISRDRAFVVKNLSRLFILGVAIQRTNRMGMGYSTHQTLRTKVRPVLEKETKQRVLVWINHQTLY